MSEQPESESFGRSRVSVTEELSLPVVCQDEWYNGGIPSDISLDDAELVFDERGDPSLVVTVSAVPGDADE